MIYGYARVSTLKQSLQRQLTNLRKYNASMRIYQEEYSGRHIENRKELLKLLRLVQRGDVIVFDSVSRMSRNAEEGFNLYLHLFDCGVDLVFLNEPYINTAVFKHALETANALKTPEIEGNNATQNLIDSVFTAIREFQIDLLKQQIKTAFEQSEKEVNDIRERITQGMRERRAKGLTLGTQKGATKTPRKKAKQIEEIKRLSKTFQGELTDKELMKVISISPATLFKYKREIKEELQGKAEEASNAIMNSLENGNSKSKE